MAVAAIKALCCVLQKSSATTLMELERALCSAVQALQHASPFSFSLRAGCALFLRHVARTILEQSSNDLGETKRLLLQSGHEFSATSVASRKKISMGGSNFIRDGHILLTHGSSRVVLSILRHAAGKGIHFSVIVTEGRPDGAGVKMARLCVEAGLPVSLVLDVAVAYVLPRVDMVLLGAEGVVESGGVVSKLGCLQAR